jgi:tRNA-dihydrouridine synthase 1
VVSKYINKSNIIRTLHDGLKIPVTAKIRVLPTEEETVELAKRIEASGA